MQLQAPGWPLAVLRDLAFAFFLPCPTLGLPEQAAPFAENPFGTLPGRPNDALAEAHPASRSKVDLMDVSREAARLASCATQRLPEF